MNNNVKHLLIFCGSPHENGHTAKMIETAIDYFDRQGNIEVSLLDAYKTKLSPCIDCRYCAGHEGCAFKDFAETAELLERADIILFASPVYFLSFPAPLKAVIDRFEQYYCAHFFRKVIPTIARRKAGGLLCCCGSGDRFGFEVMQRQLRQLFSVINTRFVGAYCCPSTDSGSTPDSEQIERLCGDMLGCSDEIDLR